MKVGDVLPLIMNGYTVAEAVVEDMSDGKATFIIPPSRFKMAIKHEIVPLDPEGDRVFAGLAENNPSTNSDAGEATNNNKASEGDFNTPAPSPTSKPTEPPAAVEVADAPLPDYTTPPEPVENKPTPIEDIETPPVRPRTGFAGEPLSLRDMDFDTDILDRE